MKNSKSKEPSTMLLSLEDNPQLQQAKTNETLILHQQIKGAWCQHFRMRRRTIHYNENESQIECSKSSILSQFSTNGTTLQHTYNCDNEPTHLVSNLSHRHSELEKLLAAANV